MMDTLLLPAWTLMRRELVRFYRQRDRVMGALVTPLVFWAFIGSGFGKSFRSGDYLEFLYPGIIVLTILFTAIFSTISIIEDRREGFLQSVLVAPVSRASMVLGKILGATMIAMIQGGLFLVLAPFLHIPLQPGSLLLTLLVMFVIAFGLSNLGFLIAWRSESTQGFHAIMNLLLMPMWLLSGAFFPADGAPGWIGWLMRINPLTYGMSALRTALHPASDYGSAPSFQVSLLFSVLFAALVFAAASYAAGRQSARDLP
jgi:ABC-2 type transport system permease protein